MVGTTVLAIGSAQGIFLTLVLLLKNTANRRATRALTALVGVFTALALGQLLQVLGSTPSLRWIDFVILNVELTIGPLTLFFVRYIFDPDRPWRVGDAALFLPFVAGVVVCMTLYFHQSGAGLEPSLAPYRTAIVGFVGLKALFFYTCMFRVRSTLREGLAQSRPLVAGRQRVELNWMRHWILGFVGTVTVLYGLTFAPMLVSGVAIDADGLANIVLVLVLYLLTLMALLRPGVLSARPRRRHAVQHTSEVARLQCLLDRERPFLDPDLTLRDLAEALDLSENRLSVVLNEGLGTSFHDLVSSSRLAHFERLAADRTLRERTVLDLAFESGFNSKASFYRSFKSSHQLTPTAFRRLQLG